MAGIHPETTARIVGLAHQMGYVVRGEPGKPEAANMPQVLRHVLSLSQSNSPHTDQRYMAGMSGAAVAFNVAILSHLVPDDQCGSVLEPRTAPASFRSGMVNGIVLLHRWPQEIAAQISATYPTVSVVHDYPGSNIDLIGTDDRRGMFELLEHLYAGGHRRIGFFGLCPEVSWSCARFAAFVEALTRLDLEPDMRDVVRIDMASALSSKEFNGKAWKEQVAARLRQGVDAWVCSSSMTGQTLCRHLMERGLRLPDDVSLVSYHGGSYPRASDLPFITTTDIVDEELGAAAVRRLINRIDNPAESRRSILVPAKLAIGATTRTVSPSAVTKPKRKGAGWPG
jgi:DNA-binding LacI/PurR family transcriptional regulator